MQRDTTARPATAFNSCDHMWNMMKQSFMLCQHYVSFAETYLSVKNANLPYFA